MGETEQPWDELLTTGQFSTKSLDTAPCSFNVSDEWITLLSESARHHGATWLHHLHLGVAMLEQGKFEAARKNFTASISLKDNALSQRCLALLNERDGNTNTTTTAYQRAWALGNNDPNLAVEIADFYFRNHRYADFADFKKSLPPQVADHERIVLQTARIALEEGQYDLARQLIDREFITVREGEVSLSELWFASYQKEAEHSKGRPLTTEEQQDLMQKFPPPRQIDFRKQ
jgi:Tfp pilus assembly protein PilF